MKIFCGLALVVLTLATRAAPGREGGEPSSKVLFIGNSYTSVNDLPSMVMGLPSTVVKDGKLLVQIPPETAKRLQVAAWQAVQEPR